jgi:cobalt-precorrin 5A hydrolase
VIQASEGPSIAVFALTEGGAATARRVAAALGAELHLPAKLSSVPEGAAGEQDPIARFERVGPALQEAFVAPGRGALVCVMASGVVVRSLAPVLRDKKLDPAVLLMDEQGRFVVPLLSGHLGGANALAQHLARELAAEAVLTTSSDVQGFLGPDLLARTLEATVADPAALLPVTSALVNGRGLELWFDADEMGGAAAFLGDLEGYRPHPLEELGGGVASQERAGVAVSTQEVSPSGGTAPVLWLVPQWVTAGVGCKRGTQREALVGAVRRALGAAGRDPRSLRLLASARIKADEPGLFAAADALGVPAVFARDEDLAGEIKTRGLRESEFVREQAGVGAVAEPAALWAAGEGARLLLPKQAEGGVTVALALADGGTVVRRENGRWR